MENFIKKILLISAVLLSVILCNVKVSANTIYKTYLTSYGFDVDGDVYPLINENNGFLEDSTVVYWKEKLEHTTSYLISHFQFDGTNLRGIVYRITTKPYQPGRYWGFLGIGSYGDDFLQDSINVYLRLQQPNVFMNYAPRVKPTTGSMGVSASYNGDTFGISVTHSYDYSDLSIINNSDTVNQIYDVTYDFNQNVWNNYTTSEQYSYGIILYEYVPARIDEYYMDINIKYHDWNGGEPSLEDVNYYVKI